MICAACRSSTRSSSARPATRGSLPATALDPRRVIGFYPTTDAGAIGVSPADDGVYQCFTETHHVEVVDEAGRQVGSGERGSVVVTAYDNLAAPLVRYRVSDRVTYCGRWRNRVLLVDIARQGEAALGDTLVPLAYILAWPAWLAAAGHSVAAVQLARRFIGDTFPDSTPCPSQVSDWDELIEARRLTLGLPQSHRLSPHTHGVFLAVKAGTLGHEKPRPEKASRWGPTADTVRPQDGPCTPGRTSSRTICSRPRVIPPSIRTRSDNCERPPPGPDFRVSTKPACACGMRAASRGTVSGAETVTLLTDCSASRSGRGGPAPRAEALRGRRLR